MTFRVARIPKLTDGSRGYLGAVFLGDSNFGARDGNPSGSGLTLPDTRVKYSGSITMASFWDSAVTFGWQSLDAITGTISGVNTPRFGPETSFAQAAADEGVPLAVYKRAISSTTLKQYLNNSYLTQTLSNSSTNFSSLGVAASSVKLFVLGDSVAETADQAEADAWYDNLDLLETQVHATYANATIVVWAQAPALYHTSRGATVRALQESWVAAAPTMRKLANTDSIVAAVADNHPDAAELIGVGQELWRVSRGAVWYPATGLP